MSVKAALAHHAREFYWEHDWAQRTYSRLTAQFAEMAEQRGQKYRALDLYCRAARRVRDNELRRRRTAEFAGFLGRTFRGKLPATLAENPFLQEFLGSSEADELRARLRDMPEKRLDVAKNIIILKTPRDGERGVMLVKYTPHFFTFLVNFDMRRLAERYTLVLEPSWFLYPDPYMGVFSCAEPLVVTQMISEEAAEDVRQARLSLVPVGIGAQDWVDPDVFHPIEGVQRDFDVVMIASFMRLKRHAVLFRALRKLHPRRLKVALIGRTWERTRGEFDRELKESGVAEDCTIFQGLKGPEINEILNRSKVNVLLSKMEGGNVALMEALAAGVPSVVYKHIIGPRLSDVNPMTGELAEDDELHEALVKVIDHREQYDARGYFQKTTGYRTATARLNEVLKNAALARGERWTQDIVPKVNRLGLQYTSEADAEAMKPAWEELRGMLAAIA